MRDVHWVDKENMRRSCSLFYYVSIFTLPFPMITSPEGEMRALICPAVTEFNHPQPCCCCSQRNNTLLPATKPASKLLCSSLKTKKSRCENDGFSSDWTTKQLYFFFMLNGAHVWDCFWVKKLPKTFRRRLPLPLEGCATGEIISRWIVSVFEDERLDLKWINKQVIEGTPATADRGELKGDWILLS